jgi:hypothetical protein
MHRSWIDHLEFVACKRLAAIVRERSFGSEFDAKRFFCWLLFFSAHFHDPTVDQTGAAEAITMPRPCQQNFAGHFLSPPALS